MRYARWFAVPVCLVLLPALSQQFVLRADDPANASSSSDGESATEAPVSAEPAATEEAPATEAPASAEKHLLRYKFAPGETIRWHVEHRAEIRTTIGGTTQTAETWSDSSKLWRVVSVNDAGEAVFEHIVESVEMRQKLTGRQEVRYNSGTDVNPPAGFEQVAGSIGVPLTVFTVDNRGTILKREEKRSQGQGSPGQITIPLPEESVAVGHVWTFPYEIEVTLKDGQVKSVQTRQQFTLVEVANGIARIEIATQVLTPIHDPQIEAQLVQRESRGSVRLDLQQGRIISQRLELDRSVVGYAGEGSSLRYITRFTEDLDAGGPRTAERAGPALPPGMGAEAKASGVTASRRFDNVKRR